MTYDGEDFSRDIREVVQRGVAEIGPKAVVMILSGYIQSVTDVRLSDNGGNDGGATAAVGSGDDPGDGPDDSGGGNRYQIDTDTPLK